MSALCFCASLTAGECATAARPSSVTALVERCGAASSACPPCSLLCAVGCCCVNCHLYARPARMVPQVIVKMNTQFESILVARRRSSKAPSAVPTPVCSQINHVDLRARIDDCHNHEFCHGQSHTGPGEHSCVCHAGYFGSGQAGLHQCSGI